jgi:glucan phosphoethanolaminetransferase (alkaline phosphatase superfamily)
MTVAVVLLVVNFIIDRDFNFRDDIFPVNSCYNFGVAIERTRLSMHYAEASANFSYQAANTRPDSISQIYVLVIGETARADNFGILGYNRPTTPQLSALASKQHSVVAFKDALTMSNTTHKSVPMLLTSVASQGNFNDIYSQKGIFSAFRQAGYSTTFISNQRRNGSLIDFLGSEAQHVTFLKDHLPLESELADDSILTPLKACLDSYHGGRLFIVLHTYGSHFNYRDRYPHNYKPLFTPDRFTEASRENCDKLVNAYDNTIANTDALLSRIIAMVQAKHVPAGLIYASDHGEDIFDDSRHRFLHASPIPTYYQIHVPFLVWTSSEYRSLYPAKWQQIVSHRDKPISTSLVTFHTLLDMSGVKSAYLCTSDALSSPDFKVKQRLYVTDHNEMIPISKSGLKQLDIEQFRKHGLTYP